MIQKVTRALQSSAKSSIRIDGQGVLSLQFLTMSPNPRGGAPISSIVEFRVSSYVAMLFILLITRIVYAHSGRCVVYNKISYQVKISDQTEVKSTIPTVFPKPP